MNIREVVLQYTSRFDARGMAAMLTHMRKAKTEAERFEDNLRKISAAFMAFGTASVMAFKQYEQNLTEFAGKAMNTVDEFSRKFHSFSGQISRETGMIRREVLRGLQEGTSALLEPIDSKNLSKKAAILAAGKQSLMNQAVSVALSGYRNKFGKPARVLDYAYATAQLGQGQVAEFAPALQYVFGFARGAGLELKEVAAGIAAISATAPSPIMGSTQFGAFLTGIARGSTYEDKLKEKSGKSSQDLRDMLRDEGLAKTVEFLASKFSGDELQQVFGRKEFVQFVQGTTGRRGIVKQLERMIEQNANSGPIERFGKDLTQTLANKWDQFIRTVEQLGTEFGTPLAELAKVILTFTKKIMEVVLWLNEKTGGVLALLTTVLGGVLFAFTLLPKLVQMAIFSILRPITGFHHFFRNRYDPNPNEAMGPFAGAAGGAAGAAAAGIGGEAAHARAGATFASEAAMGAAGAAVGAGAATGAAGNTGYASATGRPRGPRFTYSSFEPGLNDFHKSKRAYSPRFYVDAEGNVFEEGVGNVGGKDQRRAPHPFVKEAHTRRNKSMYQDDPDIRGTRANRSATKDAARKVYLNQVNEMSRITNDMIKNGNLDPSLRNYMIHALMTRPNQDFNRGRVIPRPSGLSDEDIGKNTGWFPFQKDVTSMPASMYKKNFRDPTNPIAWEDAVDWDQYLQPQYRGKGRKPTDITPDMVMNQHKGAYSLISELPWLAPELFLASSMMRAKNAADPFSALNGWSADATDKRSFWGREEKRGKRTFYVDPDGNVSGSRKPQLKLGMDGPGYHNYGGARPQARGTPYWWRDRPRPRTQSGHRGRDFMNNALWHGGLAWDWMSAQPGRIKGVHASLGDHRNARRIFGGGAIGRGLQMGLRDRKEGESIFQNMDSAFASIASFNADAAAKGQKTMNANIAKSAFFLGKIWKGVLLNPATLATAAAVGAWYASTQFISHKTDYGRAMDRLINMKNESPFNPMNIQDFYIQTAQDMIDYNESERRALFPEPYANVGPVNSWYDWLKNPFRNTKEYFKKGQQEVIQTKQAWDLIAEIESGTLTAETIAKNKLMLEMIGVVGWEWSPLIPEFLRYSKTNIWEKPQYGMFGPKILWADNKNEQFRIPITHVPVEEYDENGLMGLSGGSTGISSALTNIVTEHTHLLQDGMRDWVHRERVALMQLFPNAQHLGRPIKYFTINNEVYVQDESGAKLIKQQTDTIDLRLQEESEHIVNETSTDVVR